MEEDNVLIEIINDETGIDPNYIYEEYEDNYKDNSSNSSIDFLSINSDTDIDHNFDTDDEIENLMEPLSIDEIFKKNNKICINYSSEECDFNFEDVEEELNNAEESDNEDNELINYMLNHSEDDFNMEYNDLIKDIEQYSD